MRGKIHSTLRLSRFQVLLDGLLARRTLGKQRKVHRMRQTTCYALLLEALLLSLPRSSCGAQGPPRPLGNYRQARREMLTLRIQRCPRPRRSPSRSGAQTQDEKLSTPAPRLGLEKEHRQHRTDLRQLSPYRNSRGSMEQTARPLLVEEKYCEIAAKRMSQEVFDFEK